MKVIIAGSRTITDGREVRRAMLQFMNHENRDKYGKITEVVCGCAKGVDSTGKMIAEAWGIPVKEFPANWKEYGKSAGPVRNNEMATYADAAIVIWDGKSPGSKNMIEQMKKLGKPVHEVIV